MGIETLVFPTAAEILEIQREVTPRLTAGRPIFAELPMVDTDAHEILWEIKDNYRGLQGARGIDGEPRGIKALGINQYSFEPGVYGEFANITEKEMLRRRKVGTFGTRIELDDIVMERQEQLLVRRLDRIEWIGWQLLKEGKFVVPNDTGYTHKDAFDIQKYANTIPWTTQATSTPLADLRAMRLKGRGTGSAFGPGAKIYVSQATMDAMLSNTNPNDLGGKRTAGLAGILSPEQLTNVLVGEGLPTFVVYEGSYFDEDGEFHLFIEDGEGVCLGTRPAGQTIGEYRMTINAMNEDFAPGPYTKVIDRREDGIANIRVHDGHNGGPILYYPKSVISCTFF